MQPEHTGSSHLLRTSPVARPELVTYCKNLAGTGARGAPIVTIKTPSGYTHLCKLLGWDNNTFSGSHHTCPWASLMTPRQPHITIGVPDQKLYAFKCGRFCLGNLVTATVHDH